MDNLYDYLIEDIDEYNVIKLMFESKTGFIYLAEEAGTRRRFIIKQVFNKYKTVIDTETDMLIIAQEVPGVAKLEKILSTDHSTFFIFPEIPHSVDLFEYVYHVKASSKLPESQVQFIIRQLLRTVIKLFEKGIVHGDIKAENIVINTSTSEITLIDFGLADTVQNSPYTTRRGTELYLPPEWFIKRSMEAEPCTVWSIGILIYSIVDKYFPFGNRLEIVNGQIIPLKTASKELMNFIYRCLHPDPVKRASLQELATHEWIQKEYSI